VEKDLATERVLAFTDMELSRRDGDLEGAVVAQRRLHGLGILVRYVKIKPSQSTPGRQTRATADPRPPVWVGEVVKT